MILPDKVKVGAHEYKVLYPYFFRERVDYSGQADHALCEIRIRNEDGVGNIKAMSNTLETFFHEVIHCVDMVWCVGLEEKQVEQLAQGMLTVLIDNGWLKIADKEAL